MIHTMLLDASVYEEASRFQSACQALSASRREKIDKIASLEGKRLSLGAGVLVQKALEQSGFSEEELTLQKNPFGKPYFSQIAHCFQFNLSHSGHFVFLAYACSKKEPAPQIGCDIERIRPLPSAIAKRFFTPEENRRIFESADPKESRDTFFRLWTLKESFMKACGKGLALPLSDFEILLPEGSALAASPEIVIHQKETDHPVSLREEEAPEGYRMAVCILYPSE